MANGTVSAPLRFRHPPAAAALLAARRLQALDHHRATLITPNTETYIYPYVVSDRMLGVLFPDGPRPDARNDPNTGPLWIQVLGVEPVGADEFRVAVCVDIGWWHDVSKPADQHRAQRASLESLSVKLIGRNDAPAAPHCYLTTAPPWSLRDCATVARIRDTAAIL